MGSDGVTVRFVRNDAMTLPSRSQPASPAAAPMTTAASDEEAEREHRLTLGDAVGGEGVDAHGTRDQRDERENAEERRGILQQRGSGRH